MTRISPFTTIQRTWGKGTHSFRRLQSFVYQVLVAALFTINVKDTQTGLKLFRREVLQATLPRVLVKRYAFDLELLVVAHHLGYRRVVEAPITIQEQFATTTNLRAAARVLVDTAAIFYRLRILKYYDRASAARQTSSRGVNAERTTSKRERA